MLTKHYYDIMLVMSRWCHVVQCKAPSCIQIILMSTSMGPSQQSAMNRCGVVWCGVTIPGVFRFAPAMMVEWSEIICLLDVQNPYDVIVPPNPYHMTFRNHLSARCADFSLCYLSSDSSQLMCRMIRSRLSSRRVNHCCPPSLLFSPGRKTELLRYCNGSKPLYQSPLTFISSY